MEWFKEWAKPAVVIVAIGLIANCQNHRFDAIDSRLKTIDDRTFEMNTRLSRIEGNLGITVNVPNNETLTTGIVK
ncbi:MAG: hypothetical protein F4X69_10725 [Gemmatimonadetes bacterium]|nr:hypothetical protein [Gemmatimonadota bacterium]